MGLAREDAYAAIRFSLGWSTTEQDIDFAVAHVREAVTRLRGQNPLLKADERD